jgi:hypothetical protein
MMSDTKDNRDRGHLYATTSGSTNATGNATHGSKSKVNRSGGGIKATRSYRYEIGIEELKQRAHLHLWNPRTAEQLH